MPARRNKDKNNKLLEKLEKDVVQKQGKLSETEFEDAERKVLEDKRQNTEGLGIEKDEDAGEEAYPEIEEALKDPEEKEEEEE